MAEGKKERRKYPRIEDDKVSMKVTSEEGDIITRSTNISASGIYCKSKRICAKRTMGDWSLGKQAISR